MATPNISVDKLIQELRTKGVFFFLPQASLYHLSICIAEGFEELGIPISANHDYYPRPYDENAKLLFRRVFKYSEAGLIIADLDAIDLGLDPNSVYKLLEPLNIPRAILCSADGGCGYFEASSNFPTFITHKSKFLKYPGWRIPWAFGLSRDILTKIETALANGRHRRRSFIRDFRASLNQPVRQSLDLAFVPTLSRRFEIDRTVDGEGRFLLTHYERLVTALGCLAYGGVFVENLSQRREKKFFGTQADMPIGTQADMDGPGPFIARWDSWRFWESLAAGCVTVALDLDEYGFELPVKPTNHLHYVGLKLDRLDEAAEFLAQDPDQLQSIGDAGRMWVLQHYAPKPTAIRFIDELAKASDSLGLC